MTDLVERTAESSSWREARERGTVFGIKSLVVFATMFGRLPARGLVALIALYYTMFSGHARRATSDLRRRLGLRTGFRYSYVQVLRFAQCALDALFFMRGRHRFFRVTRNGHHHLEELRRERRSAILLGAHLGSFYAMREQSDRESLPLHPVVYTKNARRFNAVLESLDPSSTTRLIEIGDGGQIDFMLSIREKLEEHGALVAILGDRVQPGGKTVEVDFLGGRALLPAGPYILASMLRCPVYFTAGIYRGGDRYELYCIPFAERVELPRKGREEAIARYAQKYADQLEALLRTAPDNWFNFYDFWRTSETVAPNQAAE